MNQQVRNSESAVTCGIRRLTLSRCALRYWSFVETRLEPNCFWAYIAAVLHICLLDLHPPRSVRQAYLSRSLPPAVLSATKSKVFHLGRHRFRRGFQPRRPTSAHSPLYPNRASVGTGRRGPLHPARYHSLPIRAIEHNSRPLCSCSPNPRPLEFECKLEATDQAIICFQPRRPVRIAYHST